MKLPMLMPLAIAAATLSTTALAESGETIAQKSGCLSCHTRDHKILGPAYNDVQAKYKGQADAMVPKLMEKVRKGGVGVWGPIPMPPNGPDKVNDADLKTVVEWVLKG